MKVRRLRHVILRFYQQIKIKGIINGFRFKKTKYPSCFPIKNTNGVTDLLVEFSNNENVNLGKYIQRLPIKICQMSYMSYLLEQKQ